MKTIAYQCPCCGAPLEYSGTSGKLECGACGTVFDLEAVEAMQAPENASDVEFEMPEQTYDAAETDAMQAYTCKNCGAELITDGTTTATECPYCGSPTILPERIQGGVRPERVVPFTIPKENAQKQFNEYFKGKRLLPNIFLQSRNRISEMRKLYVPYWLFDCDAHGDFVYDAEKVHTRRDGDWEIKRTEHYAVRRRAAMRFDDIPVDGSQKLDDKITESLEPYDMSAAVPFQSAVLSGAMADHADVDAKACETRAEERVKNSVSQSIRSTVTGYDSVTERSGAVYTEKGKATPVLMPVWLITTEKDKKTYTFAINGQTGKLTCDVPVAKGKAAAWFFGVGLGIFGVGALILWLLEKLASGSMLMLGLLALVIALVVVSGLKAQLKQASHQSAAANYIRDGSFDLQVRYDHFLYADTERTKIEKEEPKKEE